MILEYSESYILIVKSVIKDIQNYITYYPFFIHIGGIKITIEKKYIIDNDNFYTPEEFDKKYQQIGVSNRLKTDIIYALNRLLNELNTKGLIKNINEY